MGTDLIDLGVYNETMGWFVLIFSTALGSIANLLALKYFFTRQSVFFNALKVVALSDIFICQLSTFYGLSLVYGTAPLLFEDIYFCWGWNMSWRMAVWFSSHLLAIQSVFRTIKIFRPFLVLPKNVLKIVLCLDLIIICGLVVLTTGTLFTPIYTKSLASCMKLSLRQHVHLSFRILSKVVSFILVSPYLVTLACCVMCLIKLVKQNRVAVRRSWPRNLVRNRSHSITSILAFSVTGLILNLTSYVPFIMEKLFIEKTVNEDDSIKIWFLLYANLTFRQIIITVNSVLNPFIFFWRMTEVIFGYNLSCYCYFNLFCEMTLLRNKLDSVFCA